MTVAPSSRRTTLVAALLIAAGVANNLPSFRWGFIWDDFIHQAVLRGDLPGARLPRWNLYDFAITPRPGDATFDAGIAPWWTDPDFKARFFRPVASLTIWLDYAIYHNWAPGYHVTSLALLGVFLVLAWKLYYALGAPLRAALWALAFLALDDVHCMPVGWIANRNTLLAALFVVATVLCVDRNRETRRARWLLAGLACFLLACGSKESGVAALPIIGAYVLFFGGPAGTETLRARVHRVVSSRVLWSFGLAAVAYAAFYVAAGYGSRSVTYPVPWHDPMRFLSRLAWVVPAGLMHLTYAAVTDFMALNARWAWQLLTASAILLPAAGFVLARGLRGSRVAGLAVAWALFALLAEGGGDISDRLWMNAAVGTALLFGLFLDRLPPLRQRLTLGRAAALTMGGVLILTGIVAAVPMTKIRRDLCSSLGGTDRANSLNADIDIDPAHPLDVFALNSPSSMGAMSLSLTWRVGHDDLHTRIFPLQLGRRPLTWTRDDERTMTLTSGAIPFRANPFERVFCTRAAPPAGTTFTTAAFTATVLASEPAGFRTVRFQFHKSLDDPSYRFLAWRDGRLCRTAPPPVGDTVQVPEVPPPTPYTP
jgi:hypothetical protein